jgi:von Willebrand factor type D domain
MMLQQLLTVSLLLISGVEATQTPWSVWGFMCGNTMYTCGDIKLIPSQSQCKSKRTAQFVIPLKLSMCTLMKAQAALQGNGDLYKSTLYCPNKAKIVSFFKYRKTQEISDEGYPEWHGKICQNNGKECKCCNDGNGFGDPHFLQYDGTPFSYHGKCDMVMAHSESFGNGLGLRVHGRTEIVDNWSRIRNAAVQIGQDTVELSNKGVIYLNGKVADENMLSNAALSGVYNITKETIVLGNIPKTDITVRLNEEHREKIKLSLYKNIINVHVGADEDDLQGMLGHKTVDGFVGRNKMVLEDHTGMGNHWQVRDNEPMIFAEAVAPQFPDQCVMPVADERRLRTSQHVQRRAEEACAGINNKVMRNFCTEDITLSGDFDLSHVYHAGFN